MCVFVYECLGVGWGGVGGRGEGIEGMGEWRWEDTPCRTFRLCHKQLHIGIYCER